jgi:hypothetical protein
MVKIVFDNRGNEKIPKLWCFEYESLKKFKEDFKKASTNSQQYIIDYWEWRKKCPLCTGNNREYYRWKDKEPKISKDYKFSFKFCGTEFWYNDFFEFPEDKIYELNEWWSKMVVTGEA